MEVNKTACNDKVRFSELKSEKLIDNLGKKLENSRSILVNRNEMKNKTNLGNIWY